MTISTNITRGDLMKLQLYMVPRLKGNWIFFGLIVIAVLSWALYALPGPLTGTKVISGILGGIGGALAGTAIGALFNIAYVAVSSTAAAGVLGAHQFEIQPEGLFERTAANESLYRWSGINSIRKSRSFIFVGITGYIFHIIPRRSFSDAVQFQQFFDELQSKWRGQAA